MKIYPRVPQKSSNLADGSLSFDYGLNFSVAAGLVAQGQAAHLRIYDAALRMGLESKQFYAAELIAKFAENDIEISMATVQRALVDTRFFRLVTIAKTGKPGRPRKMYTLVKPKNVDKGILDLKIGSQLGAPQLGSVDAYKTRNYILSMLGRYMVNNDRSSRAQQMEFWGWSKPTLIRWTREVCDIKLQVKRISSEQLSYRVIINGDELFLSEVAQREATNDRRYWLEVVTDDGEIRKMPCRKVIAEEWLRKGEVVICQQLPNLYITRAAYRDLPNWEGQDLPF